MPICSYLALPIEGHADILSASLGALPGCQVVRAMNRDVMVLLTETEDHVEEAVLRARLEATHGLAALVLTFGEIQPEVTGGGA